MNVTPHLERVRVQLADACRELLHVLRDALVGVRQPAQRGGGVVGAVAVGGRRRRRRGVRGMGWSGLGCWLGVGGWSGVGGVEGWWVGWFAVDLLVDGWEKGRCASSNYQQLTCSTGRAGSW